MQLSAPSLPFDSSAQLSADGAGFPSFGSKADGNASGANDFGAMLTAKARNETSGKSAATSSGPRPGAVRNQTGRPTSTDTDSNEILAAAGLVAPPEPVVTTPKAVDGELDIAFISAEPGVTITGSDIPTDSSVSGANAHDSIHGARGRPFMGDTAQSKARASLRAYGSSTEGSASRNGVLSTAESFPSVATAASSLNAPISESGPSSAATSRVQSLQSETATPLVSPPVATITTSVPPVDGAQSAAQPSTPNNVDSTVRQSRGGPSATGDLPKTSVEPAEDKFEVGAAPLPASPIVADASSGVTPSAEMSPPKLEHPQLQARKEASATVPTTAEELMEGPDQPSFAAAIATTEKIAAQLARDEQRGFERQKSSEIVSLSSNEELVTEQSTAVGINVAKPESLMSATASNPTSAALATEPASLHAIPLSFDALVKEDAGENTAQASLARRAVESILNAADQLATTDQRSVRLQFTVGGEELAVRVELRGEKVHTTFRTDSSELRSALAHEWQSVSAVQNGVRTQRLADPVFASNSSANSQGFSADSGAAHQRDSAPRHPHGSPDEIFGARRAFSNTTAVSAAASTAPAPAAAPVLNPLRLHTFA